MRGALPVSWSVTAAGACGGTSGSSPQVARLLDPPQRNAARTQCLPPSRVLQMPCGSPIHRPSRVVWNPSQAGTPACGSSCWGSVARVVQCRPPSAETRIREVNVPLPPVAPVATARVRWLAAAIRSSPYRVPPGTGRGGLHEEPWSVEVSTNVGPVPSRGRHSTAAKPAGAAASPSATCPALPRFCAHTCLRSEQVGGGR
jgi:hypothetical protein